jgi:hypothetical protein
MAKKKSSARQIRGIKKEHALWVAIIILTALLVSTIWYILKAPSVSKIVSSTNSRPLTQAEEQRSQDVVNEIEERRYRYPVIDVKENRVYIPEARMYVPLSEDSRDLRYEMWGETIWLSLSITVGRQTGNEDASCDKVVIFTPSPEKWARGYAAAGTVTSKDGSTRYILRHPACKNFYGDEFSQKLADVIKQVQYY